MQAFVMSESNSVGRLQEWTQRKKIALPDYKDISSSDGKFQISVTITGVDYTGIGEGTSKTSAKQAASRDLILFMKNGSKSGNGSCSSVGGVAASVNNSPTSVSSPSRAPSTSTPLREPSTSSNVNFVSRLQEWAQHRGLQFPVYRDTQSGEMRNPFCFLVFVPTKEDEGRGVGRTKKEAKQAAAKALYEALTSSSDGYASANCASPGPSSSLLPGSTLSLSSSSSSSTSFVSNVIGKLQEMAVKQGRPLPSYDFASNEDASTIGFPFVCTVQAFDASAQGGGKSKKEAKQEAAKELWMMVESSILKDSSPSAPSLASKPILVEPAEKLETSSISPAVLSNSHSAEKNVGPTISADGKICELSNEVASSAKDDCPSVANSELSFLSLSSDQSPKPKAVSNVDDGKDGVHYVSDGINYVGKLQEESVRRCIGTPRYQESPTLVGNDFSVQANLPGLQLVAKGFGKRKKEAKNAAAKALYVKLMASSGQEGRTVETPVPELSRAVSESVSSTSISRPSLQPAKLDFSADSEADVAVMENFTSPSLVNPTPRSSGEDFDNEVNYVGQLKEYLDKKTYGQARYEDDIGASGVSATVIVDGVKIVGRGTGLAAKKKMRQVAAKDLMHKLCPISSIPCSPIGMIVGDSPIRKNCQSDPIDEDAFTSVSLATPMISASELVDSAVDLDNAEDELDKLIEDLDLPMAEYKISKMKTKGEVDKVLHMCVITIDGEREKIGSGDSRVEATQRAACNMVLHLRYKHKIARGPSKVQMTASVTADSALGMSHNNEVESHSTGSVQNSFEISSEKSRSLPALSVEKGSPSPVISEKSHLSVKNDSPKSGPPMKNFKGFSGSEPRLNLMQLKMIPPRTEVVSDKSVLMTLAGKPEEEVGRPLTERHRRVSDPGAIAQIFFNVDEGGMPACYASFRRALENCAEESDVFRNTTDRSASSTQQRRKILEDAGVRVTVEPVVRERATNEREEVRGKSSAEGVLCFLKLNFDPDYVEVEEFQWNRKRRLDKQLLFGGKGATMADAEADAFVKAAEHLKITTLRS